MSQESSASELELAKEYSQVLAGTDDEDDRYLNALCESIKQDKETVCRLDGTTYGYTR